MSCHNYSSTLQGYFQSASAGSNGAFHSFLKSNSSTESPSQCSAHRVVEITRIDQPIIPNDIETTDSEKALLTNGTVDELYNRYVASQSFPDPYGFEQFVREEIDLTQMEPSQAFLGFGRKKQPDEIAAEKEKKEAKKAADDKLASERNKLKQMKELEKIEQKKTQELEKLSKETHETKVRTEKTKQTHEQTMKSKTEQQQKEWEELQKKKRQQSSSEAFGGLFGKSKTETNKPVQLVQWTIDDVKLIQQSVEYPQRSSTADIKRVKELLESLLNNTEVKNILETVSDKLNAIDRESVIQLLSVVKQHPKVTNGIFGNNNTPITQMKWVGNKIEFYDMDYYTSIHYYDVYLAFNAICKGDINKDIISSVVSKDKVTITTFEWDDDLVNALIEKLTSSNPTSNPLIINKLRQFVICICNNVTLRDIAKKTQLEISKNGIPTSELGYGLLFGLWREHSTKAVSGKVIASLFDFTSEVPVGYESLSMPLEQVKSAKVTDLVKAFVVYQKLKSYYKKNYMMQLKHQFTEPSGAHSDILDDFPELDEQSQRKSVSASDKYETELIKIFADKTLDQVRRMDTKQALEVAVHLETFLRRFGLKEFTEIYGSFHSDSYKQLHYTISNYCNLLRSYSLSGVSSYQ